MSEVTFYHTEREDNGRRTGLAVNGFTADGMETVVPGQDDDFDPAIRWYVDVLCPVDDPPRNPMSLAIWFKVNGERIRVVLEEAAERFRAGIDQVGSPMSFEKDSADGPIRVSVSAQRRYDARHVGEGIQKLLDTDWKEFVEKVKPSQSAVR